MINIAIVDQNEIYRMSLKTLLEQIDGFRVVTESADGLNILGPAIPSFQVALIDNSIGYEECHNMIRELSAKIPSAKTLILAMFREELEIEYENAEVILKSSGKNDFESRIRKLTWPCNESSMNNH